MPGPQRQAARVQAEVIENLSAFEVLDDSQEAISDFVIERLLDYETRYSDEELCRLVSRTFGIEFDLSDLTTLKRSATFQSKWPLSSYSQDPRIAVARHEFANLLGVAMERLKALLTNANTPATVQKWAIDRVLKMNQVQGEVSQASNAGELTRFLESVGSGNLQLNQINIQTLVQNALPQEYQDAAEAVADPTPDRNLIGSGSRSGDRLLETITDVHESADDSDEEEIEADE